MSERALGCCGMARRLFDICVPGVFVAQDTQNLEAITQVKAANIVKTQFNIVI